MEIAYREYFDAYSLDRKPLNPTGRWKLVTDGFYENKMFIEHKGFIFKKWISEDNIVFRPPPKTFMRVPD